jgi:hypothetical protein
VTRPEDSAAPAATPQAAVAEAGRPGSSETRCAPSVADPGRLQSIERRSRLYEGLKGLRVPCGLARELVELLESDTADKLHQFNAAWSVLQHKVIGPDAMAEWLHGIGYDVGRARVRLMKQTQPRRCRHYGGPPFKCATCPTRVEPLDEFVIGERSDGSLLNLCLGCGL